MPGPYAHITLLYELMQPQRLESIFTSASGYATVLPNHFPYCALGAVSPDYPNLVTANQTASRWADAMHTSHACHMITSGIQRVRQAHGTIRDKQLAWLLGYCAHLAADVTIHPVVQALVGEYEQNQQQHRTCEMHQDSYIYRRMKLGEIGDSNVFARTVTQCSTATASDRLDDDIATLWEGMLAEVYPELYVANPPDPSRWHREFAALTTGTTTTDGGLFPLAAIISRKTGLAYPSSGELDMSFIENLIVPTAPPRYLHYDEIFDHAAQNVAALWRVVERAASDDASANIPAFSNWNLDNGLDELGRLVFWD
jgi:hypothetical protein